MGAQERNLTIVDGICKSIRFVKSKEGTEFLCRLTIQISKQDNILIEILGNEKMAFLHEYAKVGANIICQGQLKQDQYLKKKGITSIYVLADVFSINGIAFRKVFEKEKKEVAQVALPF